MKVRLLTKLDRSGSSNAGTFPVGTEIDHPDAWALANGGHAVAVDDEAKAALAAVRSGGDVPRWVGSDVEVIITPPGGAAPAAPVSPEEG